MKDDLRKELKKKVAELTDEGTQVQLTDYAEFGIACLKLYIPALLAELEETDTSVMTSAAENEEKICDNCYWMHQQIKHGCAVCSEKSEYVFMFSQDGAKRLAAILAQC